MPTPPRPGRHAPSVTALTVAVIGFAVLALLAPFGDAEQPHRRVGVLLAFGGVLEILHGLRRADAATLRRAVMSGAISLLMGLLVISSFSLAGGALVTLLAITFAVDGLGYAGAARRSVGRRRLLAWLAAAADVVSAIALVVALQRISETWIVATAAALRLLGIAWAMTVTPVHSAGDAAGTVIDDLGLSDHPEAAQLLEQITFTERVRSGADRGWVIAFIITLFAIHIARQEPDGTLFGYAAPAIAVAGDMALAVIFGFLVAGPVAFSLLSSTRWLERRVWQWYLAAAGARRSWRYLLAAVWLRYRLRMAMRLREARFSIPAALWRSLAAGIPVAAVVAATVPVWGMSWFFDTENWASGIWNSWAEARTDRWRQAMVHAVTGPAGAGPLTFAVSPSGTQSGDFSFIVIGDTGEGDASQHALRDRLLAVAGQPDVQFVVISSDVVYPNGSMIDYETNFWLPFKGVTKPVYAIPGNHDWYDALEAFNATFLEADAARTAIRARVEADLRLSSTTDARIERLLAQAAHLRGEYEVPTGFQRGPFFEIQSDRFALVAIDTGIVKRIDEAQWQWLEGALARARGKFIMAVVGHPFYAKSDDMTQGNEPFARLKRLLVDHGVTVMMAGDTHDLEYYVEPPGASTPALHYFVNGGGGAYPESWHGARMARDAGNRRVGLLSHSRQRRAEDRPPDARVEAAGVVVGEPPSCLAVRDRVPLRPVRLQRRAVLSELPRGSSRALGAAGPGVAVRRPWPAAVEGSITLGGPERGGRRPRRFRGVDPADAMTALSPRKPSCNSLEAVAPHRGRSRRRGPGPRARPFEPQTPAHRRASRSARSRPGTGVTGGSDVGRIRLVDRGAQEGAAAVAAFRRASCQRPFQLGARLGRLPRPSHRRPHHPFHLDRGSRRCGHAGRGVPVRTSATASWSATRRG